MDIVMFFLSSRKHAKQVIRLTLDGGGDDTRMNCNHHCSTNNMRRHNHHNNSSRKRTVDYHQQIVISPPQVESLTEFGWENFPVVYVSDSLAATPPSIPTPIVTEEAKLEQQSRAASPSSPSQVTHKKKQKKNTVHKKVEFVTVQIREHALTVGEHDWCDGRLPLSLDWKHTETKVYHVDYYELVRDRKGRLPRGQLPKLDYYQRQLRLRRVSGYTQHDLEVMEMEAATKHHQRVQQNQGQQQLKKCKTIPVFASASSAVDTTNDGMFVPLSTYGNLEASEQ